MQEKTKVAILGSGAGSNARALIEQSVHYAYTISVVVSTTANAGIVQVAQELNVPVEIISGTTNEFNSKLIGTCNRYGATVLALAGYMRLLSTNILQEMNGAVVNIHPALLPKFGGKGMYGIHVHEAVLAANEPITGATVHLVTEHYDEGAIIAQDFFLIEEDRTPLDLQNKVKLLEHQLYPKALHTFVTR